MSTDNNSQKEFQELADWVIAETKKAGAKDCKVNISKRRFVEINYRDKKPEVIKEATTQGLNLQVFINNRYASQSTPDFRKSTLSGFITDVIESAKIMEEDPFRTLPDPKYYAGRSTSDLQLADPSHSELTPEERHVMAQKVEEGCLKQGGSKVISVEAGEYDDTYDEFVKSSNGFIGANRTTQCWTGANMTAQDEGDRRPSGYNWVGCRYRADLPSLDEVGKTAALRTLDLMGGKKIQTETLPIIIENRGVGRVLGGLQEPMWAGNIQQKRSFLADKKGQSIGSKLFTIQDDPFLPRALGSKYYDDDGFPTKKRTLITEGTLDEFLVNWYYSRKLGWEPNSGSISNLIIPPGTRSVDEIIRDMDRCLLITDFIGGNSNSTTGDFSVGIIGKLFNKGQFVQNVAEMNMADNHLKFWHKLVEVANDPWIYSSARLPSLVFDGVVVSGI
ncbi:TldE protein, part of TldE/TldD proteolytic complex [Aquipluma nitroreducens]|uniref:TldE protein, part of TldE/TldD proteolytic complex n=1 Tax=Aquipluma nitroreducens TaxID=2010828 RepID=A0A5K7SGA5_9BACT|nr:TldD/PmbA family protein [Aquipluma nitroreducens]BBE20621.1 TldE protein, part of TldE/TldD proteolytic complex [Aquipluma nitroreducens]